MIKFVKRNILGTLLFFAWTLGTIMTSVVIPSVSNSGSFGRLEYIIFGTILAFCFASIMQVMRNFGHDL